MSVHFFVVHVLDVVYFIHRRVNQHRRLSLVSIGDVVFSCLQLFFSRPRLEDEKKL